MHSHPRAPLSCFSEEGLVVTVGLEPLLVEEYVRLGGLDDPKDLRSNED